MWRSWAMRAIAAKGCPARSFWRASGVAAESRSRVWLASQAQARRGEGVLPAPGLRRQWSTAAARGSVPPRFLPAAELSLAESLNSAARAARASISKACDKAMLSDPCARCARSANAIVESEKLCAAHRRKRWLVSRHASGSLYEMVSNNLAAPRSACCPLPTGPVSASNSGSLVRLPARGHGRRKLGGERLRRSRQRILVSAVFQPLLLPPQAIRARRLQTVAELLTRGHVCSAFFRRAFCAPFTFAVGASAAGSVIELLQISMRNSKPIASSWPSLAVRRAQRATTAATVAGAGMRLN